MRMKAFLARNAISLCSLFVAVLSLLYTTEAQRLDATYREAAIRPKLELVNYPNDFSFGIRNYGVGPAVIKRIAVRAGGDCYDSNDPNQDKFYKGTMEFMESTHDMFVKVLFPILHTLTPSLITFKNFVSVGTIIPSGEFFPIRNLDDSTKAVLKRVNPSDLVDVSNKFRDEAYKIPLTIQYCSITGLTCEITPVQNDDCNIK